MVEDRKAEELIANCSIWTDEAQQWEDWEPLMYAKQTVSAGRRRRKRKQKEALRDRLYGWLVKEDRQDLVEDMDWQESGEWNVRQLEEQQKREDRRWRARILQLRWKERKKVALATEAWCREEIVSWLWRVLDQQTRDNLWDRQTKAARREVEWWEEEERRKCDVEMTEVEEEQYGMETDDAPDACMDCVEPVMMMDHCVELKEATTVQMDIHLQEEEYEPSVQMYDCQMYDCPQDDICNMEYEDEQDDAVDTGEYLGLELGTARGHKRRRNIKVKHGVWLRRLIIHRKMTKKLVDPKETFVPKMVDSAVLEPAKETSIHDIGREDAVRICAEVQTGTSHNRVRKNNIVQHDIRVTSVCVCGKCTVCVQRVPCEGDSSNNDIQDGVLQSETDGNIISIYTPPTKSNYSTFFDISTNSQNKLGRAAKKITVGRNKKFFERNIDVGFKMGKLPTLLLKTNSVKRKVELFETLAKIKNENIKNENIQTLSHVKTDLLRTEIPGAKKPCVGPYSN
jgi:hypothetical protein